MKLELEIFHGHTSKIHTIWTSSSDKTLEEAVLFLSLTKVHYYHMINELKRVFIYSPYNDFGKCIYRLVPN